MTRLYYLNPVPGLALSTQIEMARKAGMTAASAVWTDSAKTFPRERGRLLKALRKGQADEVWVAHLAMLFANRLDLRHFANELTAAGASILEDMTGWTYEPPYERELGIANLQDYWAKRRRLTDDPRSAGVAARSGGKNQRMPEAMARPIWFDPTIPSNAKAIEKMNADPRYRKPWKYSTAAHKFGKSGRPPGVRPKPAKPEQT